MPLVLLNQPQRTSYHFYQALKQMEAVLLKKIKVELPKLKLQAI
jgi:hypothetical protein